MSRFDVEFLPLVEAVTCLLIAGFGFGSPVATGVFALGVVAIFLVGVVIVIPP